MSYRIVQHPRIEKQLDRLPNNIFDRVEKKIRSLAENPRPRGCDKIQGYPNEYRVWAGRNYRIRYKVYDSERAIELVHVGHRKDVYRQT